MLEPKRLLAIALLLGVGSVPPASRGADEAKPVRMGSGILTFETVPGWGLGPDGKPVIGNTHGGVAVDRDGAIGVSHHNGLTFFRPDGTVDRSFLGDQYADMHDIKARVEGDREFIYAARNNHGEGIKLDARTGAIVLHLTFPSESGLNLKGMKPTAIAVGPDGDIYLSDGYASNVIFRFDPSGKYRAHFGTKGNGLKEFNTAHGMTLDTRYSPPRLLICDRDHAPRGRLVHYSLDGEFLGEVVTGLGRPCSVNVRGDDVAVPDLQGRVVVLNKDNIIAAVLGYNADPALAGKYDVPQSRWVEGVCNAAHGSCWDREGNLYVQDWNVAGRPIKLVRAAK